MDLKIGTSILNGITKENSSLEYGDYVVCVNCGQTMLVDIGTDLCPYCRTETLKWKIPGQPEIHIKDIYLLKQ